MDALQRSTYPNHAVFVMDAATADGSIGAVRLAFPGVIIHSLRENRGYAGNNNAGIAMALADGADWIFLLNDDAFVAPDCVEKLVEVGERDPGIGIIGPLVYHADEPTIIQSAGGWMNARWQTGHIGQNEPDNSQYIEPRDVDWLSGCALMIRRQVVEEVGELDEDFFCYWEETEWCLRARQQGWRAVNVPAAKVWHRGVRRDYKPGPAVVYYMTRNRFLLLAKHHAPLVAWLDAWAQTLRTLTSYTLRPKWRHKRADRDAMWRGVVDFLLGRTGQMRK